MTSAPTYPNPGIQHTRCVLALTFVEDACNTCPVYARRPEWRYLRQTVNTLAERLRELEPRMDEEGTAIYEEAA